MTMRYNEIEKIVSGRDPCMGNVSAQFMVSSYHMLPLLPGRCRSVIKRAVYVDHLGSGNCGSCSNLEIRVASVRMLDTGGTLKRKL